MEVEKDRKAVIIRAENGIACTQIISVDDGRIIDFWAPTATQALKNEFQTSDAVSFEKLRQITDAARVRVRVGDAHGFFSAGKTVQIREEPPAPGKQVSQSVPLPKSGDEISYWVFLPAGYDERESWPLMLFVHGSGECGPDIEAVKAHGPPKLLQTDRAENWPMITVSPQCPAGKNWSGSQLIELLDEMEKRFKVDRKSVYVTGLGMGGSATWSLLRDYPNRFAAGVPICAGFVPDSADPFLDTPIWVFHGAKDDFVDPETSRKAVEMIRKQGGTKVKLTMYPDVDHFAWRSAYDEAELYRWLLEQKRDD